MSSIELMWRKFFHEKKPNSHQNMDSFTLIFEEIKLLEFFWVFGSGLQFFGFGSGLQIFFRVRVGFGLVKKPQVGSGFRVFGYPTHHYY